MSIREITIQVQPSSLLVHPDALHSPAAAIPATTVDVRIFFHQDHILRGTAPAAHGTTAPMELNKAFRVVEEADTERRPPPETTRDQDAHRHGREGLRHSRAAAARTEERDTQDTYSPEHSEHSPRRDAAGDREAPPPAPPAAAPADTTPGPPKRMRLALPAPAHSATGGAGSACTPTAR